MKLVQAALVMGALGWLTACGGSSSAKVGSTCADVQKCIQQCQTSDGTCIEDCIALLSTSAQTYFNALEDCSAPACTEAVDGGATPPCSVSTSSTDCSSCVATNCPTQESACLAH